jgi:tRNA(Arg) A34 adenosine deaminase TadA
MAAHRLSRRLWLGGSLALALRGRPVAAAEPIVQPQAASDTAFMARALEMKASAEAAGDQAYGAVVVRDGRIVGQAPSAVVTRGDPTAHAEMEAIRDAARRLSQRHLGGSVLYSSSRPCPMCEAAAYWAGIERMIHGTGLSDAGRPRLPR